MISKAAIEAFKQRQLENWDWLKGQSLEELNRALPHPHLNDLWPLQKVLIILALELKRFMFLVSMGGGKTRTILELIRLRKIKGEKPKAIVFVPYLTAVETWVEQVKVHTPDLNCVPLLGTTEQNRLALGGDGDLHVICYQSAVAMVSEKEVLTQESARTSGRKPRSPPRGSGVKSKWQLRPDVGELFSSFDMLVCDEIHKAKGRNTLTFDMLKLISSQCPWAFGLTGTPFGKDLQDLWPQFYLIDFGETLGRTVSFYREVFFKTKVNYWGGYEYSFKKPLFPLLQKIIKHRSIHYGMEEFCDLEKPRYISIKLSPPEDYRDYCQKALEGIRQANKNYQVIESNYLQLRQLASGFMTLKGEDDSRLAVQFDYIPKLEALTEIIEGLPDGSKCVVFHWFVRTNEIITKRLTELKMGYAAIWGGAKDPIGELKRFKSDPNCRILVLNAKSGSSSLNLQNANYIVFYEQIDSPIDRSQAEHRVWRPGQQQRVVIYDLLMTDTADYGIRASNKTGQTMLKQLLAGEVDLGGSDGLDTISGRP